VEQAQSLSAQSLGAHAVSPLPDPWTPFSTSALWSRPSSDSRVDVAPPHAAKAATNAPAASTRPIVVVFIVLIIVRTSVD